AVARDRPHGSHVAEHVAVLLRDVRLVRAATAEAAASAARLTRRRNRAVHEDEDVEVVVEIAGIEPLGIHDLERELELLHDPARPAGGHGAAVAVPQRNAHGLELENLTGRTLCDGVDFDSL